MSFSFGPQSQTNLVGVHPLLVRTFSRAIEITTQDFMVLEGVRTIERQRALLKAGASKTLSSKHLKQDDGFGHACDLVPWVDGTPRWEWTPIYAIAAAVRLAAVEFGAANLYWGGVWDRPIVNLPPTVVGIQMAVKAYCDRHPGPDFIDGPHFQLGK